jgi:hypothetical protein
MPPLRWLTQLVPEQHRRKEGAASSAPTELDAMANLPDNRTTENPVLLYADHVWQIPMSHSTPALAFQFDAKGALTHELLKF